MNLIDIRNLSIELKTASKPIYAVDRVNLTMKEGEVRGLKCFSSASFSRVI